MRQSAYDIIIVGGGLVGASLACALLDSKPNLHLALIDATSEQQEDPRLLALHLGSCQLLTNLGLWDQLSAHACPIHQVHVSSQGRFGAVRLSREEIHTASLGHVIPAQVINEVLNERLAKLDNLTLLRPARLKTLRQEEGKVLLTVSVPPTPTLPHTAGGGNPRERTIHTPPVIAADGTHSTVREQLGIETEIFDYQQSAIVTITELKRSHHHIAYERFSDAGTIAMLPLTEQRCATIWSATNEQVANLMAMNDSAFLQTLQQHFGYRLGRLLKIQKRHVFPLKQVRVKNPLQQSVLLLGNAAHTLHPVAAQGLNLALYEVACLAGALRHCEAGLLKLTLEQAQKQLATSVSLSHHLARFMTKESMLIPHLRQLGMLGLDLTPTLKKHFIRRVTGKAGHVPRLFLGRG